MLQYLMMMRLNALFVLHTAHTGMSNTAQWPPFLSMLVCLLVNFAHLCKVCKRVAKLLSKAPACLT